MRGIQGVVKTIESLRQVKTLSRSMRPLLDAAGVVATMSGVSARATFDDIEDPDATNARRSRNEGFFTAAGCSSVKVPQA
jgi:hypothetical protein